MLKRLKINRFRHVAPGTELEFSDRYNVLLGKNGTGKTTLLDLISMVLRSDFSSLRGEEFDIEFALEREDHYLWIRFINHERAQRLGGRRGGRVPITYTYSPQIDMQIRSGGRDGNHQLGVQIEGTAMRWNSLDRETTVDVPVDAFQSSFIHEIRALLADQDVLANILYSFVEPNKSVYRFDESLAAFGSIIGEKSNGARQACKIPLIGVVHGFDSKGSSDRAPGNLFFPSGYVPSRPEAGQASVAVRIPDDATLNRFPSLANIDWMKMSLAVERNSTVDDVTWWYFGHAEFLFSVPNAMFNHDDLSFGQKRLLAFLYYLDVNEHAVIADELVNGMHHDWIKACLELMGTRQAFLTSQNPLLLDYLPLESAEQVQHSFIQCKVRTADNKSEFVWSNLDAEDAKQLLADYEVGIQHVGELLRVRGLW